MSGFEVLALALAIGLAAYLVYALLNPGDF